MNKFILNSFHSYGILISVELGLRIRTLRKERALSLEQLAAKSGVALATLSRIENGKGAGTFRTHQRIAEALGLSMPELYLGLQEPEQEAVLIEPQPGEAEIFTYDEKASAILLTRQVSSKQMFPQLIIIQSGGKTAQEQYRKGTERWLFGLEGAVEVTVGAKSYRITKDGTLYFKASLPHQLVNAERSVAKIISVTSPVIL